MWLLFGDGVPDRLCLLTSRDNCCRRLRRNVPSREGAMDEAELRRVADFVNGLENTVGWRQRDEPPTPRQLMKLYLTIERLGRTICETSDERLKSVLRDLEDRAQKCKKRIEARLTVRA